MNNALPPPLPDEGVTDPPPTGPGTTRRALIAVLVILVSVAMAMGRAVADKAGGTDGLGGSGTARLEAELGARYLVGMKALLGSTLVGSGQSEASWLAPFETAAHSPRQKLELEILRREVLGAVGTATTAPIPEAATAEQRRDWETWRAIQGGDASAPGVSDADRKRFEERLGWIAKLALSQLEGESGPLRMAVMAEAQRTFLGSLALMVAAGGALLMGCGLAVWALTRFASGKEVWRFALADRPLVAATGGSVWLETFAVYLGFMVLGGLAADVLPAGWAPWPQAAAFLGAAVFGAYWPSVRGVSKAGRRAGFGWHRGRGVWREIGAGLVGYCAGLPIVALGIVLTMALTIATKADASHPLNHLTGVSPLALVFLGLLAAVWAPVVEETFFRGAFYAAWRQRCGRWVSAFLGGILFAAVHPQGWSAIPALGAVGMVLALLREWRGSLIAPMTAHALNNGTLFITMLVVMR